MQDVRLKYSRSRERENLCDGSVAITINLSFESLASMICELTRKKNELGRRQKEKENELQVHFKANICRANKET